MSDIIRALDGIAREASRISRDVAQAQARKNRSQPALPLARLPASAVLSPYILPLQAQEISKADPLPPSSNPAAGPKFGRSDHIVRTLIDRLGITAIMRLFGLRR